MMSVDELCAPLQVGPEVSWQWNKNPKQLHCVKVWTFQGVSVSKQHSVNQTRDAVSISCEANSCAGTNNCAAGSWTTSAHFQQRQQSDGT